jgi:hypothetical protein
MIFFIASVNLHICNKATSCYYFVRSFYKIRINIEKKKKIQLLFIMQL